MRGGIEKVEAQFLELCAKDFDEQAKFFMTRLSFSLDEDAVKTILKAKESFKDANYMYWTNRTANRGEKPPEVFPYTLPMSSTQTTQFLVGLDVHISHVDRPEHFEDLTDEKGRLTFIGFLVYQYRKKLMKSYFRRRKKRWPKGFKDLRGFSDVGTSEKGYELNYKGERKTVAYCLKDELFKPPVGKDGVLDAGLYEFEKIMEPRLRQIYDLVDVIETESGVKKVKAENELSAIEESYAQAYLESQVKIQVYIDKLYSLQVARLAELMDKAQAVQLLQIPRSKAAE
mmetsp:Transcript_4769/g.5893  ORF Transcript_4769/g.5893 Transcript_4769/m.5893 type:complete len:286 (+) Transcript_4769:242-1099(+)